MASNGLFVCYRRQDAAHFAGRVGDHLKQQFGSDLTFIDVDAVPLGRNFVKVLDEEVSKCDALLAIIGPNWLDAKDEQGNRRLDDESDFVRIEIGTALRRDIPVIPILFDGAKIPKRDLLPDDLKELAFRNGIEVRHASFDGDMGKLVRDLRAVLNPVSVTPAPVIRTSPIANPTVNQSASIGTVAVPETKKRPSEVEEEVPPASELKAAVGGAILGPSLFFLLFIFLQMGVRLLRDYETLAITTLFVACFLGYLYRSGGNLRNCNRYIAYSFVSSLSFPMFVSYAIISNIADADFYAWYSIPLLSIVFSALLFAFRRRYL